ncbi:N-acetylmuramoyl-L-alanine amidase [Paraferrimonas sp. SM1919]|uniref:N-acetylmuramoyl-L-alanine amidase n=1 Tax=Paraferrimonas sp. SM1919 TaxID=2662263 RepID=UPI0013D2B88C|nr:N-acetylmuramoyl-L-alanine amidase [Paraferrimonas sp. SM1919]
MMMLNRLFLLMVVGAALLFHSELAANQVDGIRVWGGPDSTRVVIDLKEKPSFNYFQLHKPERLVVDLIATKNLVALDKIEHESKHISKIRTSKPKVSEDFRLVFELALTANTKIFTLPPTAPYGHRLVIDIGSVTSSNKVVAASAPDENRDIVIAVDAGHGGEDPGSIGPSGLYEKRVTLGIAKNLVSLFNQTKGLKGVLIRSGDYYIDLNGRSVRARKQKADLLLSIHADAFTSPKPRGASVWLLSSRRANTELGRLFEDKEKHSELLGGAAEVIESSDSEGYLLQTILDMNMNNSRAVSAEVGQRLHNAMAKVAKMHKKKPQYASFGVLKSSDIPSILVETGFISNPNEEKLLKSGWYQKKLAKALHGAVVGYYREFPPAGTYLANNTSLIHKVARGESLSVIASRYGVSVAQIKKANNLKSNLVKINQSLQIPRKAS